MDIMHFLTFVFYYFLFGLKRFGILLFTGIRAAETIKNIFLFKKVIKIFKQRSAIMVPQLIIRHIYKCRYSFIASEDITTASIFI